MGNGFSYFPSIPHDPPMETTHKTLEYGRILY